MHLIVIPSELARLLHEPLREHFKDVPSVQVIVERRSAAGGAPSIEPGRRTSRRGRGIPRLIAASRHASLPPEAVPYRDRLLTFVDIESEATGASDAESLRLVARFQDGDESAFEDLYHQHFASIYDFLRLSVDAHVAEDLAQDVFVSAHERLSGFRQHARVPFFAWLRAIARNAALSHLRKRRDEPRDPAELGHIEEAEGWLAERELVMLIEQLPSRAQQQAFMLRDVHGLSVPETAEVMGRTPNSVMQLASRARRRLLRQIRGHDDPPDVPPQKVPMTRFANGSPVLRCRPAALHPGQ